MLFFLIFSTNFSILSCFKINCPKKVAEHEKKDASGVRGAGAVIGAGSAPASQPR